MLKVLMSLAIAFALMTAVPAAMADDLVGVSGECYSEGYESGGSAHVAASEDEVSHSGLVNENEPTDTSGGAVEALATFAQGMPAYLTGESDAACTAPEGDADPDREGYDYLEVHVLGVQVCYDQQVNVAPSPDEWACGTRPHGPPA